jgi:hypothetical protein
MSAAARLIVAIALAAAAACNKEAPQQNDAAIANDSTVTSIDTLPPDESVGTPTNQLVNGADQPDVADNETNAD